MASFSLALTAAACSSSSSDGGAPGSADDASVADGSTTGDGASPNDGGTPNDGATPGSGNGRIAVATNGSSFSGGAYFGTSQTDFDCPTTVVGNCYHYLCADGGFTEYSEPTDDPGTLTATIGGATFPFTTYLNQFGFVQTDGGGFGPGDTIVVAATGATVPAFSESITAPTEPTLAPVLTDGGTSVSRAIDLTVSWTGGNIEAIDIDIQRPGEALDCFVDVPAGSTSTVVPASLLGTMKPGVVTLTGTGWAKKETGGSYNVIVTVGSVAAGNQTIKLE